MDNKQLMEEITEQFGSRTGLLGYGLIMLSLTGQPCDITFYNRKPLINVTIDQQVALAIMYGAGPRKLAELLSNVKLSSGEVVNIGQIWTVNPMPKEGFTDEELASVDLARGEEKVGPNGETLRKMISDTYHCENEEEENYYLGRFIGS